MDSSHTNVVVDRDEALFKSAFRDFLQTYRDKDDEGGKGGADESGLSREDDLDEVSMGRRPRRSDREGKYITALYRLLESDDAEEEDGDTTRRTHNLLIDMTHMHRYDSFLLEFIITSPGDCLVFMDECVGELLIAMSVSASVKVSLFNHPSPSMMRDMNPSDVEHLVAVRGVVIRSSTVIPDMHAAVFRCSAVVNGSQCRWEVVVQAAMGEVLEPSMCQKCNARYSMQLYHNRCLFGDKQLIKLQETPESIPEGETPHTLMVYAYGEMVDVSRPGDSVEVVGIYKAAGVRIAPRQRTLKAIFRTFIDGIYISRDTTNRFNNIDGDDKRKIGVKRLGEDLSEDLAGYDTEPNDQKMFPAKTVQEILDLSRDPDLYEKLTRSVAPNIWENENVKKGLLCQLFGATRKQFKGIGGDKGRVGRSEVHVLLCGDPSTAKSQLIQYVHNISPRGVLTTGRGTSAVGLTASVSRDQETKEFVLESGAIVLSDRGICCIDEFDKMSDTAKTVLHEAMEQQTVSIAKAGIVCTLNARASILACANPINSRWDRTQSVVENLNLGPALLSRFDLIYLMLDKSDPFADANLARHVCALYAPGAVHSQAAPVGRDLFTAYISYARSTCNPKITNDAAGELVATYLSFRGRGSSMGSKSVSATPRQLESLVRLSEALARMRLDNYVRVKDVEEAARLISVATYAAIVDPISGRIDFDQLNIGIGEATRTRREGVASMIIEILMEESKGITKENLFQRLDELTLGKGDRGLPTNSKSEVDSALRELEGQGRIGRASGGRYYHRS